jgi:hypothetical protein
MADTDIRAPFYSFVQKEPNGKPDPDTCLPIEVNCLPLRNFGELKFQMYAITLSPTPAIAFPERIIFAYPVGLDIDCDDIDPLTYLPAATYALIARVELISDKVGTVAVLLFDDIAQGNFNNLPTSDGIIEVGDCFKLVFVEYWFSSLDPETIVSSAVIGCSSCFQRVDELCWLSQIDYRGADNQFDFYYMEGAVDLAFENRVLLPFYLKNPQLASEQAAYQISNGSFIKLFERINEEVELETDYFAHIWHRALKIALAHDTIEITSENYLQLAPNLGVGVVCEAPYEIDWQENYTQAKAKTKVKISAPLSLYNSNCLTS